MFSILIAIIFLLAPIAASGHEPGDIAKSAFNLQIQEKYEEMIMLYDPQAISTLANTVKDFVRKRADLDEKSRATLTRIFGDNYSTNIETYSAQKTIGLIFVYLFDSNLSKEEKELLKSAHFNHIRTEMTGDESSVVHYKVTFTGPKGSASVEKQMKMKLIDGKWYVGIDESYNRALRSIFGL